MLDNLIFKEDDHSYTLGGHPLPSVTTMLSDMGYREEGANFYTPSSRARGNAVHLVRHTIDTICPEAKTLEEVLYHFDSLDERLYPYAEGYLMFKRETGFKPFVSETIVASAEWRFAGKLDIHGSFPDGRWVLVDTKGWQGQGKAPKYHAVLQTAMYKIAAKEYLQFATDLRVILNLPGDGKYRAYECRDSGDEAVVRNIAIIWWNKYLHGYVKMKGDTE